MIHCILIRVMLNVITHMMYTRTSYFMLNSQVFMNDVIEMKSKPSDI